MRHPPALASRPLHARTAMKPPCSRQRARRFPPREWHAHRAPARPPPAPGWHVRCTLAARCRSPPRAATHAPRSRPRTSGSLSPRITRTPPPFTSCNSRPPAMKKVRPPFLLRILRVLDLQPLRSRGVTIRAAFSHDAFEIHPHDRIDQQGIVAMLHVAHTRPAHQLLERSLSPPKRTRTKVTSIEPQHVEGNVARRLAIHHQCIELRTAFAQDDNLSIEDCILHPELLRDGVCEIIEAAHPFLRLREEVATSRVDIQRSAKAIQLHLIYPRTSPMHITNELWQNGIDLRQHAITPPSLLSH